MGFDGFMRFGGAEILNAERTAAYIAALTPQLGFSNCTPCDELRYLVNAPERGPETIMTTRPVAIPLESSNFESGTTGSWGAGWFGAPAVVAIANSNTFAHTGARSLRITFPTAAAGCGTQFDVHDLDPDQTYSASIWVRTSAATGPLRFGDPFGSTPSADSTTVDAWEELTVTWSGRTGVYLVVRSTVSTTSGEVAYVDDFSVDATFGYQPRSGAFIEESSRYRSPIIDMPEWYDPDDSDTWGFAGLYPLKIVGLDDDTRSAKVVEASHDGGSVLLPRKATREITVNGLLVGNSDASIEAGLRWLRKTLDGSGCGQDPGCTGDSLCFFSSCPTDLPLAGYDYNGPPTTMIVPGAYGWQAFNGTLTRDVVAGTDTYTADIANSDYAQYSPFAAACDDMTFRVDFPPEDLGVLVQRTNMVPNPSFRSSSGTVAVRKNFARNPVGKYNTAWWFGTSNLGMGTGINIRAKGPTTDSPNYGGGIGLQNRFVRVEADRTINRAGAGLGTYASDIKPGIPLIMSGLVKTVISGVTKVQISAEWSDIDGVVLSTNTSTESTVTVGTYSRVTYVATPPAGAYVARVTFAVGASIGGTFTATQNPLYVSEVLFEQAASFPSWDVAPYFDGDIGYTHEGLARSWTGGAHNSESVLLGPGLPNTLIGKDSYVSSSDWTRSVSYRSGAAESRVFIMGTSGFTNTVEVLESVNLPVIAGRNFYAARVRIEHLDGTQAALGAVLRLRAYDAANADLGLVAAAADTAFPVAVGGTVNVTAPSTATLPVGTSYLRAEVWWNTGATVSPTILKVSQFLVEPVSGTTIQPGTFFDGETAPAPPLEFVWTSAPNDSSSVARNPITDGPENVALEAWGASDDNPLTIDTLIGRVEGATSAGSISLTVDGCDWETVAWRLVPLTTDPVTINSVTTTWRINYDYETIAGDFLDQFPLGYYTEEPPRVVSDVSTDPIVDMLERSSSRHFRTLRGVTAVRGPIVTRKYQSCNASLVEVEFTLVAGVPHLFGEERDAGLISMSLASQEQNTVADQTFIITDIVPDCTSLTSSAPVVDPQCSSIPAPPLVPDILAVCGPQTGPVLRRYGFRIPPEIIPQWGDVVPIITYVPEGPVSQIGIKFYPTPVPGTAPADLDPCSMCAGLVINYADSNGIIIDGASEKAYSPVEEIAVGFGGSTYATGRIVERNARHLITNLDYGPLEWPVLSCGIGYLVVIETYDDVDATLDMKLVARQ